MSYFAFEKCPALPEQHGVLFPSNFGTLVLLSQGGGAGGGGGSSSCRATATVCMYPHDSTFFLSTIADGQVSAEGRKTPNLPNGLPMMFCPFLDAGRQRWEEEERGGPKDRNETKRKRLPDQTSSVRATPYSIVHEMRLVPTEFWL